MSILDKIIAAVVPEPTPQERAECRRKARALSGGSGWLAQVLDHHEQVETAFQAVRDASTAAARRKAQKWLGIQVRTTRAQDRRLAPNTVARRG